MPRADVTRDVMMPSSSICMSRRCARTIASQTAQYAI
jgi:hypothetical protein